MLVFEHVNKKIGDFQLKDINFNVEKGEYFVILGLTGAGKSILLETTAGVYKPDSGCIYFDDEDIISKYPEERNLGFVYQDCLLFPNLSVKQNIIFGLKRKKVTKRKIEKKLHDVVLKLEIKHLLDRNPSTLSGGEQQRVAIARALITDPGILLMDEPLSALDPSTKNNIMKMLKDIHCERKNTIVHVTHDFNEALYLADKIAVMKDGGIVQIGEPNEIFEKPNSTFVANFLGV